MISIFLVFLIMTNESTHSIHKLYLIRCLNSTYVYKRVPVWWQLAQYCVRCTHTLNLYVRDVYCIHENFHIFYWICLIFQKAEHTNKWNKDVFIFVWRNIVRYIHNINMHLHKCFSHTNYIYCWSYLQFTFCST